MIFATPLDPIIYVVVIVIWFLINLLITTIFLKIALGIVDAKHTDFGEVFLTAFVITLLSALLFIHWLITLLSLLLIFFFIANRHDISFCMAIIVAILAIIIAYLVVILIIIIFAALGLTINAILTFP